MYRLRLLTDILSMWKNTTNFVRVQEFKSVESRPIEVVARELASTTINKSKYEEMLRRTTTAVKGDTTLQSLDETHHDNAPIKVEDNGAPFDVAEASSGALDSTTTSDTVHRANGRATKRAKSGGGGGDGAKRSRVGDFCYNLPLLPFVCLFYLHACYSSS